MAKYKKTGTLDSYSTIRAIARAAKEHQKTQPAETDAAAPAESVTHIATPPTDLKALGAHVARTVLPEKHIIQCYECGYAFQLHGRAKQINCSKCRVMLDMSDHVIEGKSSETLKTTGQVRIAPGGIIQDGDVIAQDILLEGAVEGGRLRAMRRLEIGPAAMFAEKSIKATDLTIAVEAAITFKKPVTFRNVEVCGSLQATLEASGVVTIRPGALFAGELTTEHLVVEEGGGLQAELRVGGNDAANAE